MVSKPNSNLQHLLEDDTWSIIQKFAFKIYISFFWIKKFDVEIFLEKILWSLLNNSKPTNTLAEPDV